MKSNINLLLAIVILASCSGKVKKVNHPGDSMIHRYEVALFSLDMDNFKAELEQIAPEYRIFLGERYLEPAAVDQLKAFVADQQNREVYQEVMQEYPELNEISQAL
ncbi:MAG: hypothetical protein PHX54_08615, partial [Lentimicrobiaceae bacterium]|nr:hypothetical protein [Lentimicrobiaceae bacterium]